MLTRDIKNICVDYKGGKCQLCGYSKCHRSLHFHHIDPSMKDFDISRFTDVPFSWHRLRQELDKCILVCANCHGEIHAGLIPAYAVRSQSRAVRVGSIDAEFAYLIKGFED